MSEKLKIAYERLSKEDERENESLSIAFQKEYLEIYAKRNGITNLIHMTDDGWSGTRWDRPGFLKLMGEVESGNVEIILIKDMSRLGRDHLRVGLFLEMLRENKVRLISVADNVDTSKGEDDFMPFRNLFAEWHARDTSRKIRAIFGSRTAQGKRVTGAVIYGYIRDEQDRQKWILDEEAAPIVQRIFRSIIEGKTVTQIADGLTADNILSPTAHWAKIGAGMPKPNKANPYKWAAGTVISIIGREEYKGLKILNKTFKESYKSKKREPNPENRLVFEGEIPRIIDDETWSVVQRLRATRRIREPIGGEANPMTGILYCSDCGAKMYHKKGSTGRPDQPHHEYVCSSYRHYSRVCTCHYIRVPVIENLILTAIRKVSKYARENEAEFVERVREKSVLQQEAAAKDSRKKLTKAKRRREEIGGLIKKLYEAYAAEKIPESHFLELLKGYDSEQATLDGQIVELQAAVDSYNTDSVRADKFIDLAKRYTDFPELTAALLNEFIEKVIVHEATKKNGVREQEVEIFLNFIGKFELPEELNEVTPPRVWAKKPRHLMTDEEREILRERDRERYAKVKGARTAADQAQRAEILKGTAYEMAI